MRGIAPDATYQFKHALIQDAAYEALLKSRRKELHRQVALTINEKFLALKQAHPEVLARHWMEAGEPESASAEWSRAGTTAHARSAFMEALESYQQALTLLKLLPESPERDLRELELRYSILSIIHVTRSFSAPETIDAAECAAALAAKSGNLTRLVGSMVGRSIIAFVSGDLLTARALADQALELAIREGGPTSLGLAHCLQIVTRYLHGDLAGSEKHFSTWLGFVDDPGLQADFRTPPGSGFAYASRIAWTLGRADVARERMARNDGSREREQPVWRGLLSDICRVPSDLPGEYEQAEALAARALELSEKTSIPLESPHLPDVLSVRRERISAALPKALR